MQMWVPQRCNCKISIERPATNFSMRLSFLTTFSSSIKEFISKAMSFKSSLSCLILAMTTCLFFPNSLCCDVKDALDVRSQFLIVSRRNRNQALKSSMPNLDFRRQSCFTDNSRDIITLHTIGKVCQSKEIVGNLEDFAPGTVLNSLLHVSEYLHRLIMHSTALE